MQFAAAVSRAENVETAAQDLIDSVRRQMPGEVDLMAVFLTYHHREDAVALADRLSYDLTPRVLIGCTCESVIGGDREIEREPGISVLCGRMPGVTLTPFRIAMEEWEELLEPDGEERLRRRVGANQSDTRAFVILGDPFTTQTDGLLQRLEAVAPGVPIVGGMASGGSAAGENVLLLDGDMAEDGIIGVRIAGPIRVDTVVSQGCRPIGETLMVTRAEDNMIAALSGRPALEVAQEVLSALSPEEQALLQNGLFLGIVINEYQPTFARGDFLVRHVLGADQETEAVAIDEFVRAGQTVQFHLRDAETADEDLRLLMTHAAENETAPAGGLLFSCNGRGVRMFAMPNHDVRGVLEAVPETPLAGFFAQGELGPVGGKNFMHGFTASLILFRPAPL